MTDLCTEPDQPTSTRRQVLCGLSLALLAPAVLAACGDDDDVSAAPSSPTTGDTPTATSTAGPTGAGLVALSAVPVGGGVIVEAEDGPVLVVQPSAGVVKAFTALCTHEGTQLPAPEDGVITCPKHFSQFEAATGAVRAGPAMDSLSTVAVRIEGDQVVLV